MSRWPYNTAAWQRLRQAKLSTDPLCEACVRREVIEPAIAVDHVVAIEKGGDPFPPIDRLMSLCLPCHNSKTRRVDSADSKGGSRFKGCDVEGNPLDDEDDWWAPGGFASPGSTGRGPPCPTKKELVSPETNWEFV
ncbi:HNH endonuclease signature motif containing protein [Mesorhizobium sp. WSM3626]|uniref:HNH endonuclease signature motif containing protein n=1 Tax=Mesorhizobium sp. WSM3626 TaxID=1040987 RepID=UPI0009FE0A70|nr:HNH endonuclease signature motif containing protein [Mesorhizobium sp. WSM3626]